MKEEIEKRLRDAIEQHNKANEQLVQLKDICQQLRGRIAAYQEMLEAVQKENGQVEIIDAEPVADKTEDKVKS